MPLGNYNEDVNDVIAAAAANQMKWKLSNERIRREGVRERERGKSIIRKLIKNYTKLPQDSLLIFPHRFNRASFFI